MTQNTKPMAIAHISNNISISIISEKPLYSSSFEVEFEDWEEMGMKKKEKKKSYYCFFIFIYILFY